MQKETIDLQYLIDQAEIHALHLRYFRAIDHGDKQGVGACFTDDLKVTYHGRKWADGISGLVDNLLGPFFESMADQQKALAYHFMGNMNIMHLDRNSAETEVYAFSARVGESGKVDEAAIRGLRYLDRLRRVQGQWLICERQHVLDWAAKTSATFSQSLAQRVNGLPVR